MTNLKILAVWIFNIVLDSGGHFAFKFAAIETDSEASLKAHWRQMFARPWMWFGVSCFIAEFIAWLAFLSLVPLAQGVLLGTIGIVVVMVGGRVLFHERFTSLRIIGMSLIIAGVAFVGIG